MSASKGRGSTCPAPPPSVADTTCFSGAGCRDITFDGDGLVSTFLNPKSGNIYRHLLVQPSDGKIVALGQLAIDSVDSDFLVARYYTDGSLDTSFGDIDPANPFLRLGYTAVKVSTGQDRAVTGGLQADGRIIAAGFGAGGWAAVRLNTDGSLDTTFAAGGKFVPGIANSVNDMAIQSDGQILLIGEPDFTVLRLSPNGSLDGTFGTGGKTTIVAGGAKRGSAGTDLALQTVAGAPGMESVLAGGWSRPSAGGTGTVFTLMRLRPNGSLDTAFGTSGIARSAFYNGGDQIGDLAVEPLTGKIYASGLVTAAASACTGSDFGLARYSANGILDPTFSGDGKLSVDVYGGSNSPGGLVLQTDGKPVIAGASYYTTSSGTVAQDATVIRFNIDGTPDPLFGPGFHGPGVVTTRFPGETSNWFYALAVQEDGRILACGTSSGRLDLARYLP
jgi:uncharacterized delta-60 repeat protein